MISGTTQKVGDKSSYTMLVFTTQAKYRQYRRNKGDTFRFIAAIKRRIAMLPVFDIAKYFLVQTKDDDENYISHLKLQKLVYYAQGFHLAIYDTPLFPEPIEAWTHGPVVDGLYQEYKEYNSKPIPCPEDIDPLIYDSQTKDLLDDIYKVFGQYSGWKLREMTHREPPWKNTLPRGIITHDALKSYFKTQIVDDEQKTQKT